jgi:hypothetical protein
MNIILDDLLSEVLSQYVMDAIGFTNQFDTKLGIFSLDFNNLDNYIDVL